MKCEKPMIIREELRKLKELRKKKKWSQQEAADKVPCHQSYYSKVERGIVNVSFDEFREIVTALGGSIIVKG